MANGPSARPSHGQRGGAGRRRHKGAPRRDQPGARWRALSGRTAGIRSRRVGGASTAARRRLCQRRPRQRAGEIPCAGDARRGDEPVPLRQLWQCDTALPLHTEGNRALSGRISGPLLDRIDMQLEVTAVPVRQITESARKSRRPTFISACRPRGSASRSDTRAKASPATRNFPRASWKRFAAGRRMPRAARQSLRHLSPFHARGQPRAQGRADDCRSCGRGGNRQGAPAGSAALSKSGRKLLEVRDGNHAGIRSDGDSGRRGRELCRREAALRAAGGALAILEEPEAYAAQLQARGVALVRRAWTDRARMLDELERKGMALVPRGTNIIRAASAHCAPPHLLYVYGQTDLTDQFPSRWLARGAPALTD